MNRMGDSVLGDMYQNKQLSGYYESCWKSHKGCEGARDLETFENFCSVAGGLFLMCGKQYNATNTEEKI